MTRLAPAFTPDRFVPEVEVLEDRTAPAVQILQAGNLVFVQGDAAANRLLVLDYGSSKAGAVQIVDGVTGQTLFRSRVVNKAAPVQVLFRLGAGNDIVSYNLAGRLNGEIAGRLASAGRILDVGLDAGNDIFRFAPLVATGQLFNTIGINHAALVVNVGGGDGNDQISLSLPGGLAADETTYVFQLVGGAGNDTLVDNAELFTTAQTFSSIVSNLVGGPGQDTLVSLFTADITATGFPFPVVQAALFGDPFDHAVVSTGLVGVFGVPLGRILFV
jgi:hypothetical protein